MEITNKKLFYFKNKKGACPFIKWIERLDVVVQARIENRLQRMKKGNYGDFKKVDKSILELRLNFGPGYRVYFAEISKNVLLLLGGDKGTQQKDIDKAKEYYKEFMEVHKSE